MSKTKLAGAALWICIRHPRRARKLYLTTKMIHQLRNEIGPPDPEKLAEIARMWTR